MGSLRRFATMALLALTLLFSSRSSQAQSVDAQRAFDAARDLMKQGKYAEACAKFEESQRIEAGMATQFRLAECYEKDGRIASAWKNYVAVASSARAGGMKDREAFALQRADELAPKLSILAIQVPADIASLAGLKVTVDGGLVQPAGWGRIPVDPGTHLVEAAATGYETWSSNIETAGAGKTVVVKVTELVEAREEPPPALQTSAPTPELAAGATDDGLDAKLIAGLVVGGLGVVAIGAGIGIGFAAKSKYDDAAPLCDAERCNQEGFDKREDARTLGNVGTGVFAVGAAFTVTGIVLLVTSALSGGDDDSASTLRPRVALAPGWHAGAFDGVSAAAEVSW